VFTRPKLQHDVPKAALSAKSFPPRKQLEGSKVRFLLANVTSFVATLAICAAPAAAQTSGLTIASVINRDMIDVEVRYLESVIGPARRVTNYRSDGTIEREYRVQGCEVRAIVRGTKVTGYHLSLTPNCTFDIGAFLGGRPLQANLATFGQLAALATDSRYRAWCIIDCGNAADPVFYLEGSTARSAQFIEFTAEVSDFNRNGTNAGAVRQVQTALLPFIGIDGLSQGRGPCHRNFQTNMTQAFATTRISGIAIGYGVHNPRNHSPDCR
jgi:hypothetical protein